MTADRYSWMLLVDGDRMASGSGGDERRNFNEGMRYLMQYASEGKAVVTFRNGRKKIGSAEARSMLPMRPAVSS